MNENDSMSSLGEPLVIPTNVFEDDESPKLRQPASDQPNEKQNRSWLWIGLFMVIGAMSLSISLPVSIHLLRGAGVIAGPAISSERLTALIQSRLPSVLFDDTTSPESRALVWMAEVDTYNQRILADDQLVQRFAMAAVGYSINGLPNWLTGSPECSWGIGRVGCNPSGHVNQIVARYDSLSGSIPVSIGLLTNIEWLVLNNNDLVGTIPTELGGLTALSYLHLDWNDLTGSIPSEIGSPKKLSWLDLSGNDLTGSIPTEVGGLTALTELDLSRNDFVSSIPSEMGGLSSLTELWLYDNRLSGTIPVEVGGLTSLNNLLLNNNKLTGTVPTEVGGLTTLTLLYLHNNTLTGTMPTGVCDVISPQIDCSEIVCDCCQDSLRQRCP